MFPISSGKDCYLCDILFNLCHIFPKTLKYCVGVQRGHLTLCGEGASLALVGHRSSDGTIIKIPYAADVLSHRPASHPIFSHWVG